MSTQHYIYTTVSNHLKEAGITESLTFNVTVLESTAICRTTINDETYVISVPITEDIEDWQFMTWDQTVIDSFNHTVITLKDAGFTLDDICLYMRMDEVLKG